VVRLGNSLSGAYDLLPWCRKDAVSGQRVILIWRINRHTQDPKTHPEDVCSRASAVPGHRLPQPDAAPVAVSGRIVLSGTTQTCSQSAI